MTQNKWDKYFDDESPSSTSKSTDKWDKYFDEDTSSSIPLVPDFNKQKPGMIESLKQNIPQWYEQALSGLSGAKSQLIGNPTRAAANIAGGIADIPADIMNLPFQYHNAVQNLLKIHGIKTAAPDLPSQPFSYHAPEHFRKWLGIPEGEAPGDVTLQMAAPGIFSAAKLPKIASKAIHAGRLEKVEALKSHLESIGFDASEADNALKQAESESLKTHKMKGKEALEYSQNENVKKINALKEKISEPLQEPNKPAEPSFPATHEYNAEEPSIKSAYEEQLKKAGISEEAIKEHLGEGQIHHERFATAAKEHQFKQIEEPNKKQYAELDKNLNKIKVQLPGNESPQKIMQKMGDIIKAGGYDSDELKELAKLYDLSVGGKTPEVNARKLLGMYRTARDARYEAVNDMRTNPSDEGRMRAKERMLELKKTEDELESLLTDSIGEENNKLLTEAQTTFKEKIAPLRGNSFWREILKSGKVKGNILEKLVGNEKGLNLIQDMVAKNPELRRLAVGQSFSEKPAGLFKKSDILKKHLASMPELRQLMSTHKLEMQRLEDVKKLLPEAQAKDLSNANKAEKLNKQIGRMQSDYIKELEAYEKNKAAHKSSIAQRERHHKEIMELEAENENIKKTLDILKERTRLKNQTLEQKIKIQKEYDAAKMDYDEKKGRIKRLITTWGLPVVGVYGGAKFINRQL